MSEHFDYGPVQRYEVVWMSGHVETVLAHQITWPQNGSFILAGMFGSTPEAGGKASRVQFHAEVNGRWLLTLSALEEDIRSIRLVTAEEPIPDFAGGEPA